MSDDAPLPGTRYSYTVNGVTYESKRWRFGSFMPMTCRDVERSLATDIKPIGPLVFYDPHNPSRSCLVPGQFAPEARGIRQGIAICQSETVISGTDAMLLMHSTASPATAAEAPNTSGKDCVASVSPRAREID